MQKGVQGGVQTKDLFTASEVAKFCQVDLKTIHNWADRGEIRHFRTPGRHLRFRRVDVLDFLRRYGYPIPETLAEGRPRVVLIDPDPGSRDAVQLALDPRFEVEGFSDPIEALVAIGSEAPDIVVMENLSNGMDAIHFVSRLKNLSSTQHVRFVVYASSEERKHQILDAGASAVVRKPDTTSLRETLNNLLGLQRPS